MRLVPFALSAFAALMIAGLATAQTTEQTEEQPTEPTEEQPVEPSEEDPVEPTDEDPAEPTEDAPADEQAETPATPEPQITVQEFGAWQLRCEATTNNCFMYQRANNTQGEAVMEINIVALPEDSEAEAGATIVAPLGSLLQEGIVIQVDSQQAKRYAFSWCTRSGCFARFGFVAEDIAAMKRGAVARTRIVSVAAADQPVVLEMSLTGFTAAYDALVAAGPTDEQ